MLARVRTTLLLVALVACHHDAAPVPPQAPPGLACAKVAEHLVAMLRQDPPPPEAVSDKIAGVITHSCETDAWTEPAKQCMDVAASIADAQAKCALTQPQLDNVNKQMDAAFGAR